MLGLPSRLITKPFIPDTDIKLDGLDVPSFWQPLQYENIHLYCRSYGHVGHMLLYEATLLFDGFSNR